MLAVGGGVVSLTVCRQTRALDEITKARPYLRIVYGMQLRACVFGVALTRWYFYTGGTTALTPDDFLCELGRLATADHDGDDDDDSDARYTLCTRRKYGSNPECSCPVLVMWMWGCRRPLQAGVTRCHDTGVCIMASLPGTASLWWMHTTRPIPPNCDLITASCNQRQSVLMQ